MDRAITQAEQLSTIIRSARKSLDIDQADIAARLAITQGRYSQLETNISRLTVDRLLVILNELGLECVVRERQAMRAMQGPGAQGKAAPSSPANLNGLTVGEALPRIAEGHDRKGHRNIEPIVKKPTLGYRMAVGTPSATTTLQNEDVKTSSAKDTDKDNGHV